MLKANVAINTNTRHSIKYIGSAMAHHLQATCQSQMVGAARLRTCRGSRQSQAAPASHRARTPRSNSILHSGVSGRRVARPDQRRTKPNEGGQVHDKAVDFHVCWAAGRHRRLLRPRGGDLRRRRHTSREAWRERRGARGRSCQIARWRRQAFAVHLRNVGHGRARTRVPVHELM